MRNSISSRVTNRHRTWLIAVLLASLMATFGGFPIAYAFHGGPHPGTYRTWAVGADPIINGFDPHETVDDPSGLTAHVATMAAPITMVTSMENTGGGFCGFLFWNPATNVFKSYKITGGFQFAVDINRSTPSGAPMTFGGGDAWATVNGNSSFSPYVNFRGSNDFRRWDVGVFSATGIRVNPATGKVYFGSFSSPGEIVELDPATNTARKWTTGSMPYNLVLDGPFVFATGVAGNGQPDQILRLNPGTNELKRWDVPGGGFQGFISFGTPNSITADSEGGVWFTQSASDQLGRLRAGPDAALGTADDVIDEYTKAGVDNPHAIASSGAGATLQSFYTEANPPSPGAAHVSVLTNSAASPTSATVPPSTVMPSPTTSTVAPVDFTSVPDTATITPVDTPSMSTNGSGIDRFPIPGFTSEPTGMTRVVQAQTVFGSMEGSDHVFRFVSEVIVAPPPTGNTPGKVTGGGHIEPDGSVSEPATMMIQIGINAGAGSKGTFGFVIQFNAGEPAPTGNLQYTDHGIKKSIKAESYATLVIGNGPCGPDTHARFTGKARVNGTPNQDLEVEVDDCSEPGSSPGSGPDTFKIMTTGTAGPYMASGPLVGGNIQIHKS